MLNFNAEEIKSNGASIVGHGGDDYSITCVRGETIRVDSVFHIDLMLSINDVCCCCCCCWSVL